MTYDQWKTAAPDDDEGMNFCAYCGELCEDTYCNSHCKREDLK